MWVIWPASTAASFVATVYIVPAIGLGWWYGIITIINGVVLILAFFFVVETKFDRPEDAMEGEVHLHLDENGNPVDLPLQARLEGLGLVLQRYGAGPSASHHVLDAPAQRCLLQVYLYQASTFAQILMSPPYLFQSSYFGWVQLVQVLDCVGMVPLLWYGSDRVVKFTSRWRKGSLNSSTDSLSFNPAIAIVTSCVLYGQAAQFPDKWSWMATVAPYHLVYFAFLRANLVSITYVVDNPPDRAGPLLLSICAGRGFISFALS
ncbi:putative Major facilitator superfamily (MFS) profile domain-containing protein [Seiridium cardinale]